MASAENENALLTTSFSQLMNANIPSREARKPHTTIFGQYRKCHTLTCDEKTYLACGILAAVTTMIFTVYRFKVDHTHEDLVFGWIVMCSAVFCVLFGVEGVLGKRPCEILIFLVANVVVVTYLIANYVESTQNTLKLVRLILAGAFCFPLLYFGLCLLYSYSREIKFYMDRVENGSFELQTALKRLVLFQDLLKLDAMLGVEMLILTLQTGAQVSECDIVSLIYGCFVRFASCIFGWIATKQERRDLMWAYYILATFEFVYIIYTAINAGHYVKAEDLKRLEGVIIACCCLACLCRVVLLIVAGLVHK